MEVIFGTSIAVLFIVIYKIVKEINEIKKQLDTKKTDDSSELNKNLD
jgi:predicted Holliday junction resolvase-like endonuclease